MATGENDTIKVLDPRKHLYSYGIAGIIVGVFLAGLVWAFPKVVNRMLQHFDVEEAASKETVNALGSTARAIEGMSTELRNIRDALPKIDGKRR